MFFPVHLRPCTFPLLRASQLSAVTLRFAISHLLKAGRQALQTRNWNAYRAYRPEKVMRDFVPGPPGERVQVPERHSAVFGCSYCFFSRFAAAFFFCKKCHCQKLHLQFFLFPTVSALRVCFCSLLEHYKPFWGQALKFFTSPNRVSHSLGLECEIFSCFYPYVHFFACHTHMRFPPRGLA